MSALLSSELPGWGAVGGGSPSRVAWARAGLFPRYLPAGIRKRGGTLRAVVCSPRPGPGPGSGLVCLLPARAGALPEGRTRGSVANLPPVRLPFRALRLSAWSIPGWVSGDELVASSCDLRSPPSPWVSPPPARNQEDRTGFPKSPFLPCGGRGEVRAQWKWSVIRFQRQLPGEPEARFSLCNRVSEQCYIVTDGSSQTRPHLHGTHVIEERGASLTFP